MREELQAGGARCRLLAVAVAFAVLSGVAVRGHAQGPTQATLSNLCGGLGCDGGTQVCAYVYVGGQVFECWEMPKQE